MAKRRRHLGWRGACRSWAPAPALAAEEAVRAQRTRPRLCAPPRGGHTARSLLGRAVRSLPGREHDSPGAPPLGRHRAVCPLAPALPEGLCAEGTRCPCPLPARRWSPPLFPGVRRTRPLGPRGLPFPSPGPAPWSSGSSFPGVRVHAQPRAQHPACGRTARACLATRQICAGDGRRTGPLPATALLLPVTTWCFGKLVHRS